MSNLEIQPAQTSRRSKWTVKNIVLCLGAVTVSTIILQNWLAGMRYAKGEAAYESAECDVAISHFDRVINAQRLMDLKSYVSRAETHKIECQRFMEISQVQEQGEVQAALLNTNTFLANYPNSPLIAAIRQQMLPLVEQQDASSLAQIDLCHRYNTLTAAHMIPDSADFRIALGTSCGQLYEQEGDYGNAIALYEKLMATYPDHALRPDVEAALAKAMVADARESGAGEIPQPPRSGSAERGSTVVVIQNDSPERMRIVFTGAETQFAELEPCTDCQSFLGEAPSACPELGPVGVYTLKPGQYSVMVTSVSDSSVIPFVGEWDLRNGAEYNNCFYLVQQPI